MSCVPGEDPDSVLLGGGRRVLGSGVQVEAHVHVHLVILHGSHLVENRDGHLDLLSLLVHSRDISEELHEHAGGGTLLPARAVHHLLHPLDDGQLIVILLLLSSSVILLIIIIIIT